MADARTAFLITTDDTHEGGFQKNPNDRGNWTSGKIGEGELKGTNHGISAMEFPDLDIENLTKEDAIQIYIDKYWIPEYTLIRPQAIANKLADLGVLFNPKVAVEVLQHALAVPVDGIFGPFTLQTVNNAEPDSLLLAYKAAFVTHAIAVGEAKPAEREFVSGWIKRINS